MTNPPYATGPAFDPNRPQQRPNGHAPQGGDAVPVTGPAPLQDRPPTRSFRYQPHDPYAHLAPGQDAGPVLPPPPTFAERWGFRGQADRPKQVTVILQTLWIHLALVLLVSVIGIPVSAANASALGFVIVVLGFFAAAACLVLIWATAKERLGRLGFASPLKPILIALGAFGLNALFSFFSVWTFVPALAETAAALLVLVLFYTRPARAWLRDREGNQPKQASEQRPLPGEDFLAARPGAAQPASWPASPVAPPAQGGHASAPAQGWPQPPQ